MDNVAAAGGRARFIATVLLGCAAAGGASAAPTVRLAWSTYLRSGPGYAYTAVNELEHDTPVSVVGCTGRWCRISTATLDGFVDRDALVLPRIAATPTQDDCVTVPQPGGRRPQPTRFCSPAATAAPGGRTPDPVR